MNFYVPMAPRHEDAENLWDWMRDVLKDAGRPTTSRRIRALVREHADGGEDYIMVGGDLDDEEASEDPIQLIFEAKKQKRTYFFCPASTVVHDMRPVKLKLGKKWRVVEFDG